MENNKDLYQKYEQEKLKEKAVPEFDLIKFMENYKRNVDFFNSYGLKPKVGHAVKVPLGHSNQ